MLYGTGSAAYRPEAELEADPLNQQWYGSFRYLTTELSKSVIVTFSEIPRCLQNSRLYKPLLLHS